MADSRGRLKYWAAQLGWGYSTYNMRARIQHPDGRQEITVWYARNGAVRAAFVTEGQIGSGEPHHRISGGVPAIVREMQLRSTGEGSGG